jgi:hypothetical protein
VSRHLRRVLRQYAYLDGELFLRTVEVRCAAVAPRFVLAIDGWAVKVSTPWAHEPSLIEQLADWLETLDPAELFHAVAYIEAGRKVATGCRHPIRVLRWVRDTIPRQECSTCGAYRIGGRTRWGRWQAKKPEAAG